MLRAALIVALAVLPISAQLWGDFANGWGMIDFRAYACASQVLAKGDDPYRAAPLHACEARAGPERFLFRAPGGVTVPAPYPPYALVMLRPFVGLPPAAAAIIWMLLSIAACVACVALLAHVAGVRWDLALAALTLCAGLTSLPSGQIFPFCLAALLACAVALQRGRFVWAAVWATLALIEPHVGLPAAIALFVWVPQTRASLAAFAIALIGISLAAAGPATCIEYFAQVLPAHALAEVSRDNQYSLTTILASAGMSELAAARIGTLSYALMLAVALILCRRLAKAYDNRAYIALLPPALCLLGGSFVHIVEIAAAVPVAMLLAAQSNVRAAARMVTLALAVPWMSATSLALGLAPLFPVAWLVFAWTADRRRAFLAGIATLALVAAFFAISHVPTPAIGAHASVHAFIDPTLAQRQWRDFVLGGSTNRLATWLLRAPTWIALAFLVWISARSAQGTRSPNGIATATAQAR